MTVRIFDQVNRLGVRSTVTLDPDHKMPIIGMQQDCMPIIEQNKREANEWQPSFQRNALGLRKIATIPLVVLEQMRQPSRTCWTACSTSRLPPGGCRLVSTHSAAT